MKFLGRMLFLCFSLGLLSAPSAHADWINLSGAENARNIAEISIEKDHVRIQLEVFVEDLMIFVELIPENLFSRPLPGRPGLEKRQQLFAENVFQVITDQGKKLPVRFERVEPRMRVERPSPFAGMITPYTRRPIPGPPADERVLYAELSYPFEGQPQSLTFVPPLDERGLSKASIGFICYHRGVRVVDFRVLSINSTLQLDWEDPWYSEFDKKALRRKIGTGMRTFLYIEPYEVRNEILVRVKDLMHWVDFDLRGREYIEEDEFNRVREQIGQFFLERENVRIDGQRRKPILDRTAFVESSVLRSRFIETPERVPLNTAMVGVIITYLTDGIPQQVSTEWELFSKRVQKVTARMTDPAGPFPYDLTPDDNVLSWTNYLKTYTIPTVEKVSVADRHKGLAVPLGSALCLAGLLPVLWTVRRRNSNDRPVKPLVGLAGLLVAGALALIPLFQIPVGTARASQVSDEDAKEILHSLLKNLYRAFDFREESDVYDKLAISVSGELLTDIYLQNRQSMAIQQAGGAQAKVEQIEIEEVAVEQAAERPKALAFRSRWTATGSVGHWGHVHTRQNQYEAILTLEPVEGHWKIVDLELLEEKRINPFAAKGSLPGG